MIGNRDQLIAAAVGSQHIPWTKLGTRTLVSAVPFSVIDIAGQPGAGVLAGTNTANGVVPTDATAGCPPINAFGGGNRGVISRLSFSSSVACRLRLYDMLFKAGAYAFNANTTLASQPSYSARVPGGTDFTGTQIWIEAVTAFTGNPSFAVTYTDQAGNPAHTTGTVGSGVAMTVGRMLQLQLASADSGVQKIESVVATVASAGTFNVLVLRPLGSLRCKTANDAEIQGPDRTGLVEVFDTSALFASISADSVALGIPDLSIQIANG